MGNNYHLLKTKFKFFLNDQFKTVICAFIGVITHISFSSFIWDQNEINKTTKNYRKSIKMQRIEFRTKKKCKIHLRKAQIHFDLVLIPQKIIFVQHKFNIHTFAAVYRIFLTLKIIKISEQKVKNFKLNIGIEYYKTNHNRYMLSASHSYYNTYSLNQMHQQHSNHSHLSHSQFSSHHNSTMLDTATTKLMQHHQQQAQQLNYASSVNGSRPTSAFSHKL